MTAIFISHSSADNAAAGDMKAWLESQGHTSLFLDFDPEAGIQAGGDWERTLYYKLRQCQAVIALLTPSWLASKWCFVELAQARAGGKAIFPVKVQDCQAGGVFSDVQQIDLTTRSKDGYRRLELGLKACGLDPRDIFDWNPKRSPYPGLRAFQAEDAAIFFGRGEEILKSLETLESLRRQGGDAARFVLLLGASGSGKSSLARAGVIPRLRKQTGVWLAVPPFRPQEDPLEALAVALSAAFDQHGKPQALNSLRAELYQAAAQDPVDGRVLLQLARELTLAANQPDATVLLTVDQLEELFGYSSPEAATRFLRLLRAALEACGQRLLTLATLRSDFLAEFQNHPALQDRASEYAHHFRYQAAPVDPLPLRNFPQIIEGPARLAGLQLEEGLVEAMVRDTGSRDALPLLAFALRRLYERYGQDGRLTLAEYEAVGGLEGAIREEAQRVLTDAHPSADDLDALHAAFVPALVRINAEGGYARRRAVLLDLPARAAPMLRRFVDARLLVTDRDADGREVIEVAHEALLRAWPQLGDWLAEDQDKLRLLDSLQRAAEEWGKGGRRPDLLIHRDGRLQDAEALLTNPRFAVAEGSLESAYLNACSEAQHDREVAEKEEQERRLRDAERIAAAQQRTARRTGIGLVVSLLLLLFAGWQYGRTLQAAEEAQQQKQYAEQAAELNHRQQLIAEVDAKRETVPQQAGLLAAEIIKTPQKGEIVAAEQALRDALATISGVGLSGHDGEISAVAIDPRSRWLATSGEEGTARLWDLNAANPAGGARVLRGHAGPITAVAFDPQDRWLVTAGQDGTARLWDLNVADPAGGVQVLRGHAGGINAVAVDPRGRWLATGGEDGTARLWDLSVADPAGGVRVLRGHAGGISAVAIDAQGRWLVTGSQDHTARLWDLSAPDPTHSAYVLTGHQDAIRAASFDPQGRWLVTGDAQGAARLWNLRAADPTQDVRPLTGHKDEVRAIAFDPQGRWLVTGSAEGAAQLWNLRVADPSLSGRPLRGHTGGISAVAFDPQGRWLVTGSDDRIVRVWDLDASDPTQNPRPLRGHERGITRLAFDPQGLWLVTGSRDHTARLWKRSMIDPAQNPRLLRGHKDRITVMAIDSQGQWLATGGRDGAALWDLRAATPRLAGVLTGQESDIAAMTIDPQGRWLLSGGVDGAVRRWDLGAGQPGPSSLVLSGGGERITAMAIDEQGRWLLSGGEDGAVRRWDLTAADPARSMQEWRGHKDRIEALAIDPQGHWLVTGGRDGAVRRWDLTAADLAQSARVVGDFHPRISAVAIDSTGRWVAVGDDDGVVQLWDLTADSDPPFQLLRGHQDRITAIAIDPQGRWLVTGSRDHTTRVWDLSVAEPGQSSRLLGSLEGSIWAVAIDPQGRFLATGGNTGVARLWDLQLSVMLDRVRHAVGRNLTRTEWEQYFPGKSYCPTFPDLPVPVDVNVADDCPRPNPAKSVVDATPTNKVITPETGAGAPGAAAVATTEPVAAKGAAEEPKAALNKAPAPPVATENEAQGQSPAISPAPPARSNAAVETPLAPAPQPVRRSSPATPPIQPPANATAPERSKVRSVKPMVRVGAAASQRPASKPATSARPSRSAGWQIRKAE